MKKGLIISIFLLAVSVVSFAQSGTSYGIGAGLIMTFDDYDIDATDYTVSIKTTAIGINAFTASGSGISFFADMTLGLLVDYNYSITDDIIPPAEEDLTTWDTKISASMLAGLLYQIPLGGMDLGIGVGAHMYYTMLDDGDYSQMMMGIGAGAIAYVAIPIGFGSIRVGLHAAYDFFSPINDYIGSGLTDIGALVISPSIGIVL